MKDEKTHRLRALHNTCSEKMWSISHHQKVLAAGSFVGQDWTKDCLAESKKEYAAAMMEVMEIQFGEVFNQLPEFDLQPVKLRNEVEETIENFRQTGILAST